MKMYAYVIVLIAFLISAFGARADGSVHVPISFCVHPGSELHVVDVNADGRADLVCKDSQRIWIIYARNGTTPYPASADWVLDTNYCTHGNAKAHFVDVNGDGRADLICRDPARIWVDYADVRGRFAGDWDWHVDTSFCTHRNAVLHFVDTNGDGRVDLLCRDPRSLWAVNANQHGRYAPQNPNWVVETAFCTHARSTAIFIDVNGDGRADLLCRDAERLWVSYADGSGVIRGRADWVTETQWCTRRDQKFHVGDFNADRRADMLCVGARQMWVAIAGPNLPFNEMTVWSSESMWCDETRSRLIVAPMSSSGRADLLCHDRRWLSLLRSTSEGRFDPPLADRDNDGLHDWWETNYSAQTFALSSRGSLSPARRDLIWVPVLDPGGSISEGNVREMAREMTRFFADVPITNPDGSRGIALHVAPLVHARGICPLEVPVVRLQHFPPEFRAKAHGTRICEGGGGRTAVWGDFSQSGPQWETIVHEIGHHFGLEHEPLTTGVPSPFYTSILNYAYQTGVGDGPPQFSTGRFSSLNLDERNLDERLPFPIDDLRFLSHPPYEFDLQRIDARNTSIDFNRNGVHAERGVMANINAGYSIWLNREVRTNTFTAGGLSVLDVDGTLLMFIPQPTETVDWATDETDDTLSPARPGKILVQSYRSTASPSPLGATETLVASGATGAPHAAKAFGRVFLAVPRAQGYQVQAFEMDAMGRLENAFWPIVVDDAPERQPVLVRIAAPREELWLFDWGPDGGIGARQVTITGTSLSLSERQIVQRSGGAGPLVSNSPIGVTAGRSGSAIYLVTTAHSPQSSNRTQYRMMLSEMTRVGGIWTAGQPNWLTSNANDYAGTRDRPEVIFDRRMGRLGDLLVYFRRDVRFDDNTGWMDLVRVNFDIQRTVGRDDPLQPRFGWTKALLGNEWTVSRSAPAAALHGDDVALAFRWPAGDIQNMVLIQTAASGIGENNMSDFDDVSHIRTIGMREPLRLSSW